MTNEEARLVLKCISWRKGDSIGPQMLLITGPFVEARAGDFTATLDGDFTADQLEAIAMWMRDPEGVLNATEPQ